MLLFVYLIANRLSHVSGIYFLPDAMILDALKIDRRVLDTLWNTLAGVGLAYRDKDRAVVLVPKMFKRQGRGEKNHRAAANQIASLHNSPLINMFLDIYPEVRPYVKSPLDTVSIGYPGQDESGIQDQDQDQDQEKGSCGETCSSLPPPAPLLVFPCVGEPPTWSFTQGHVEEWGKLFPDMDIIGESRKAYAWVTADTKRRKTAGGMRKFLVGWYGKGVERGTYLRNGRISPRTTNGANIEQIRLTKMQELARQRPDRGAEYDRDIERLQRAKTIPEIEALS